MTSPMHPASDAVSERPTARDRFLETYRREVATTAKVMRAFPAEQLEFRPHDRSSAASRLAFTFVVEAHFSVQALRGQAPSTSDLAPPADSWEGWISAFEAATRALEAEVGKKDPHLTGTVQFYVGPKQPGTYTLEDFLWFMLHDQIHHRGQLSVYLRMVGGRVPSIYGGSGDEPWT